MQGNAHTVIRSRSFILLLGTLLAATGCTSLQWGKGESPSTQPAAEKYSQIVEQDALNRIEQQLKSRQFKVAEKSLQQLDLTKLSSDGEQKRTLLLAILALLNGDAKQAITLTDPLTKTKLAPSIAKRFYYLRAEAFSELGQPLASVQARSELLPLLTGKSDWENRRKLWHDLVTLAASTKVLPSTSSEELRGWLALAKITQTPGFLGDGLTGQLMAWHQKYSKHPIQQYLKPLFVGGGTGMPKKVALLLPMSGSYKAAGQAVSDGIMAALGQSQSKSSTATQFYDTNGQNVVTLYQQAVKEGAQWVIGPLLREEIDALAKQRNLTVPTLALNYLPESKSPQVKHLFQFGLLPEDEVTELAQRMWQAKQRRAIAVVPKREFGDRLLKAFRNDYSRLGGNVSGTYTYQNGRITPEMPIDLIKRPDGPQAIFFVAGNPSEARTIRPQLFYSANEPSLPVYANSHIFSGQPNAQLDRELNGSVFCDAPYLFAFSNLMPVSGQKMPKPSQTLGTYYLRLYALGIDAFHLIKSLDFWTALPEAQFYGATGQLLLRAHQRIHRDLSCGRFNEGVPQLLPIHPPGIKKEKAIPEAFLL